MDPSRCNGCNTPLLPPPPSYQRFLRREEIPPPFTAVRTQIMQQKHIRDQLDEDILRLQKARRAVSISIREMESLSSPIRTLPEEILSNVMEIVVLGLTCSEDGMPQIPSTPPAFARVCKWWRDVALATPMLWRFLHITPGTPADHICKLLERSGQVPLTLTVEEGANMAALLPVIAQAHRWECICFDELNDEMRLALNEAAGQCHTLKIFCFGGSRAPASVVFNTLQCAGRLETLILYDTSALVLAPWSQLITLQLRHMTAEECLPILKLCIRLAECHLWEIGGGFTPSPLANRVIMGQLRQIKINQKETQSEISDLFLALALPALQSLVLAGFDERFSSSILSIVSDLRQISSFNLQDCDLTTSEVVGLLKMLPSLRNLTLLKLKHLKLDMLLDSLLGSPVEPALVPLLSSIDIQSADDTINTGDFVQAVDTIVRSRWQLKQPAHAVALAQNSPPFHLSSVSIRLGHFYGDYDLLRGLVDDGFDIRLYKGKYQVL